MKLKCNLTKRELNDYMNCYMKSEVVNKKQMNSKKPKTGLILAVVSGKYKADNVICSESTINGKVVRVHMTKHDLKDLIQNRIKSAPSVHGDEDLPPLKVQGVKRKFSKDAQNKVSSQEHNKDIVPNKKQKNYCNNGTSDTIVLENKLPHLKDEHSLRVRSRTPNKKFSDFIWGIGVSAKKSNLDQDKSRLTPETVKKVADVKVFSKKKELKVTPEVAQSKVIDRANNSQLVAKSSTDSTNPINKRRSPAPNPRSMLKINDSIQVKTDAGKSPNTFVKARTVDSNSTSKSKAIIKRNEQHSKSLPYKLVDIKRFLESSDEPEVLITHRIGQTEITRKNSAPSIIKKDRINGQNGDLFIRYTLVPPKVRPSKKPTHNNFNLTTLASKIKLIKLPTPNWKVRIIMSTKKKVFEITFTNKLQNERLRAVTFLYSKPSYDIIFGKSNATLLGAPKKLEFKDISILLDIVNTISDTDPILELSK